MLDEFLKNELSFNRESGTYLFYGDDLEKNYSIALEFSAELFSRNIENEDEKSKIKESKLNEFSTYIQAEKILLENIDELRENMYNYNYKIKRRLKEIKEKIEWKEVLKD